MLSCPDIVLANVAARTRRIRLAPAVTVLPLHHPIRVAEQWATLDLLSGGRVDFAAGRGYDRREYLPFHVNFDDNQGIFDEGMEIVRRLWAARGPALCYSAMSYGTTELFRGEAIELEQQVNGTWRPYEAVKGFIDQLSFAYRSLRSGTGTYHDCLSL